MKTYANTNIHKLIAIPPIYPHTYIQYKYKICNTHQLGFRHISVKTYEKSHPVSGEYGMGY